MFRFECATAPGHVSPYMVICSIGVRLVVGSPVRTIETNVHGTETVLRQASRQQKHVLIASTSEVYGHGTVLPFREDANLVLGAPTSIRWGYAASKLLDEFMALAYWKEHRVPVIVVRLFNTVGPRQSSRYGMVMPNFVRQALCGEPITVHGDGSQTRSFTWVGDVVSAMLDLINEPRAVGEVFNIGNGAEISIRELAEKVKALTKSQSAIRFVPYHEVFDDTFEDMARRVPDIGKIHRLIGYMPRVHLEEILERVIQVLGGATRCNRARTGLDEVRGACFEIRRAPDGVSPRSDGLTPGLDLEGRHSSVPIDVDGKDIQG